MNRTIFYILFFTLVFSFQTGFSQEKDDKWDSAGSLYAQGRFTEALELYGSIAQDGYSSWQLFYNIANCHFKTGNYGKAILFYERALKLNPTGKDIGFNLNFTRQFTVDKIDAVPEFILNTWIRDLNYKFNSDTWTIVSLFLLSLTALLLLAFRYGPSPASRKTAFFVALFTAIIFLVSTCFAYSQKASYHNKEEAVIMVPVSTVRNSPDNSGATLFILHEGTKVELMEELGSWKRVELSDGRQGWIAASDLEII
jgi:tetratricopeptide (TPR) repeat protein